ncbi:MAG: response regulator transcription factor [Micropruina sp.]|uniref:response regulator n=1 Tax=Micropruina sp. TaxID=2737536 RepID=UPI0039E61224
MTEPHRVLVVDDDPAVRAAYRAFLGRQPGFEVVGEARNGEEGVQADERLGPDVILMDLDMPVVTGVEATRRITARRPDACVVVLTTFSGHADVVAALRAGASGYLLKDVGGVGLLNGIRQALAGDMPLSSAVRRELVGAVLRDNDPVATAGGVRVTRREQEMLGCLAQGLTNQQISTQLHLSEGSVKQYLSRIGAKLGVKSRTGILIRAVQLDLIDPHVLPPPRN